MDKTRTWCPRAGCETVCLVGVGPHSDATPSTSTGGGSGGAHTATFTDCQGAQQSLCAVQCPSCKDEFCSACKKAVSTCDTRFSIQLLCFHYFVIFTFYILLLFLFFSGIRTWLARRTVVAWWRTVRMTLAYPSTMTSSSVVPCALCPSKRTRVARRWCANVASTSSAGTVWPVWMWVHP